MKTQKSVNWQDLLTDSSKALVDHYVIYITRNPDLFHSLLDFALSENGSYSQRAARVVCYYLEQNPDVYTRFEGQIINKLESFANQSIKFTLLKIFTFSPLPKDDQKLGILIKICFDLIEANVDRIALKVYAADILYRVSNIYPDIKHELLDLLQKYSIDSKAAFINRASKLSELLRSEIRTL